LERDKIIGEKIILPFYLSEFSTRTPVMQGELTRKKQSVHELYIFCIRGRKLRK
jgi:hypothetical protein